ncbi:hypothetical protein ACTXIU_14020 [Glutamicibacter arilaitensis]|uniref:hypothetical protein n=1 Tax=Glutamicibacter TaxID=1742989 RepID=UPI0002FA421F|nr:MULTISPECIES: hypothetical protein [Glutamicibacter]HCH47521.1 hypothetical protein [Glutamicibacter sp.]HCM96096.1 hypothetical protein [Glutamicibacter sp.]
MQSLAAGLPLGKDLLLLISIDWQNIPVGLVSSTASFLCSVMIVQFALDYWLYTCLPHADIPIQ